MEMDSMCIWMMSSYISMSMLMLMLIGVGKSRERTHLRDGTLAYRNEPEFPQPIRLLRDNTIEVTLDDEVTR